MSGRWEQAGSQAPGSAIGLPPVIQRPGIPIRARLGARSWFTLLVVRPSWLWRRELWDACVLSAVGVWAWVAVGSWPWNVAAGVSAPLVVVGVWAAVPWTRRGRLLRWRRARLRRKWDAGCRFAGLTTVNDRIPRIMSVREVPAGELLRVRVPKGSIVEDLEAAREHLAAHLRVRDVRVARNADRANLAAVEIVRRDPFLSSDGRSRAVEWPWVGRERGRLWEPVPVGVDELGETVTLDLPERGVLLGGEPGSGKSAGLAELLGAAALDPWCRIWGLDAKQLELSLWEPVVERVAYQDMDQAINLVEDLVDLMDQTYTALKAAGLRKMPHGSPLHMLAIDELRFYTAHPDRKRRNRFNGLLIDLEARGRAAGIIPVKATQKPSTDVVPSSLRDLSAVRWAMRCTTRDASDTVLGAGWASLGYSAADIDSRTPGVGWLLHEGGMPQRVKSFYLDDDHIRALALRGAALRREVATSAT